MSNSSASDHGAGYFLYHSIGMYQGKAADLAREMAAFAESWGMPNDTQWPYILERRQHFIDLWRQIIGAPAGTVTTCESVTQGVHSIITALPESHLRGRRILVAADCFPSVHFLLAGLAPRLGFTLDTSTAMMDATLLWNSDFAMPDIARHPRLAYEYYWQRDSQTSALYMSLRMQGQVDDVARFLLGFGGESIEATNQYGTWKVDVDPITHIATSYWNGVEIGQTQL